MSQVNHAYLNIKIDDVDITAPTPEYVQSFAYEKASSAVGNVSFTVFDEQAMQVEAMLIEGHDKLKFSYGLTPQTAKSFTARVINWSTDLSGWGALINIEAVSTGLADMTGGKRKTYQGTPDQVVRGVAQEEGWSLGIIEPCTALSFIDQGTGQVTPQVFYREGQDAITFLETKVLPYAKSAGTGKSGYYLYMSDGNGTEINFHTKDYSTKAKTHDLSFVVGAGDSDVLSWKPGYEGAVLMASQGLIVEYQDATGTLQSVVKGDKEGAEVKLVKVRTQEEARALADYLWELKLRATYEGSLSLVNHEGLEMFDKISLLALTKNNVPHHTSGVYIVTSVRDHIEGGLLYTDVGLLGGMA